MNIPFHIPRDHPILLFDGVCNLCNGTVQWVLKHDSRGALRFASLQSDAGQQLLREAGLPGDEFNTVVLYESGLFYTRSDVVLRLFRHLGGAWAWLAWLSIVPRFIRDGIYDRIARNRYRWFGKRESCMMPTPELRSRFLQ